MPPKVEYTLTELGDSLMEMLDQLCLWGTEHMPSALPSGSCVEDTLVCSLA